MSVSTTVPTRSYRTVGTERSDGGLAGPHGTPLGSPRPSGRSVDLRARWSRMVCEVFQLPTDGARAPERAAVRPRDAASQSRDWNRHRCIGWKYHGGCHERTIRCRGTSELRWPRLERAGTACPGAPGESADRAEGTACHRSLRGGRITRAGWPSEAARRADATHRRVRALLDQATHVGSRCECSPLDGHFGAQAVAVRGAPRATGYRRHRRSGAEAPAGTVEALESEGLRHRYPDLSEELLAKGAVLPLSHPSGMEVDLVLAGSGFETARSAGHPAMESSIGESKFPAFQISSETRQ